MSYAVRGLRVTASGVISHGGPTGVARVGRRVEVEEETNAQSGATEWRVLASIPMASRAGRSSFALSFKEGRAVGTLMLRVRVVSGLHVLAESPPKRVRLGPVVVVRSTLRGTSVQAPPREVESVSGSPGATQIVILARGATVPSVGGALVIGVSPHAPNGLLGVVTAVSHSAAGPTTVTTRPATLEEAYSSFDAQINGTLGELASEDSSAAAHAAASIGSFADVSFSCDDPGVQHSITHTINLSELHVSAEIVIPSYSNGFSGPFINFDLGGHPKFGLGVNFGGYASCTADATANIPLADTGLFVEIGPQFTLSASGAVNINMDWEPWVNFGFSRGRGDPSNNYEAFHSDGRTTFSGNAHLSVSLALKAGISLAGRIGVGGTIGPEIIGEVSASTATGTACLTVDAQVVAELTAHANVFFDDYNFTLGTFTFGHTQLYRGCTASVSGGGSSGGDGGGSSGGGGSGGGGSGGSTGPGGTPGNALSAGGGSACALLSGGSLDCWGDNSVGQLGDGSANAVSEVPVAVSGISDAIQVSAGSDFACALLSGGRIDCWGFNSSGQLGEGTLGSETCFFSNWFCSRTPVAVVGITDATQLSVGASSACALLAGGSIDCWGEDEDGQLGNSTTTGPEACRFGFCSSRPVGVIGIVGATQVSVGGEGACALMSSGGIDCWGLDDLGQLGDGTTTTTDTCENDWPCSPSPVAVTGITNATQVNAGGGDTCALLVTGRINCWGANWEGALGDGTSTGPDSCSDTACSTSPVEVADITDATRVSVPCALLSTGGIDCWGANSFGELGDGGPTDMSSDVPVAVTGITDATQVSTGSQFTCALLSGGGASCWGANYDGQLGDGTLTESAIPVPVSGNP